MIYQTRIINLTLSTGARLVLSLRFLTGRLQFYTHDNEETDNPIVTRRINGQKIARWIILRTRDIHALCMRPPSSHWLLILTTRHDGPIHGCIFESHARSPTCPAMFSLRVSKLLQAFTFPDPAMSSVFPLNAVHEARRGGSVDAW